MTINKNKKTKQTKASEVTSSSSAQTSSSVQTSKTTTVQQSSNTLQKVNSGGKKIRYIEVKVEKEDPLMITDISDNASVSGSTISEHYNSHPHYIITEAPSIPDLSQTRSHEHNVSDMIRSTTGDFVSSSIHQESSSSTSHQKSSKSETFQTSTSNQQLESGYSKSFDTSVNSSGASQTLNTGFIDSSAHNTGKGNSFVSRSQGANSTNVFLQSERQDLVSDQMTRTSETSYQDSTKTAKGSTGQNVHQREKVTFRNSPEPSKRVQTVKSDSSNFYGNEGSLDKNVKSKYLTSTEQTSEATSSSVTKSSSSSYVVEIVDGKERIIDSSSREWGDAQEHSSKDAHASISGSDIKPQSVHSMQNYEMKSKYDTGKGDQKPTSEMTLKEDSKLLKDGKQISEHSKIMSSQNDNINSYIASTNVQITDKEHRNENKTSKNIKSTSDVTSSVHKTDNLTSSDKRRNVNKTDSSNFYGYDTTIQNELRKVGDILNVGETNNLNFSTKIMKSNTSSAEQGSTSSYAIEIVDGKERIVDRSHREWGDNKERSSYERSHNIDGKGIKPEHEYTRSVLDKESHYDTGKDGVPTSSSWMSEQSVLCKDGKEIASTNNVYSGDFTKKKAITEVTDDLHNKRIQDTSSYNVDVSSSSTTDITSHTKDAIDKTKTTDFISTEKQNLSKESSSRATSETKDTLTSYERSTGTWNGKFVYEKDEDRPKKPKQMSPFGRPEQPRHHLKRQDTEENIILSSRDIKDFTSINDLRKIIESSQFRKDVTVSNKNIVINRNIDDKVLKEIIDTVKKYPFKRIEKVSFGTRINEDVKDLYEGVDSEEITTVNTSSDALTKKSFEIEKKRSQIEVTRYITENGITRKITTFEDAKEDEKIKTNVFVDNSALDVTSLRDVRTTSDVTRNYDVVDRAITDTREDTVVSTVYDEKITDDRSTVRDDRTIIEETVTIDERRPRHGGPKKPDKPVCKEQCICEICTCGRHRCPHNDVPEPLFDVGHSTNVVSAYTQDYDEKHVSRTTAVHHEDHLHLEGDFQAPERTQWQPAERPKITKPVDNLKPEGDFEKRKPDEWQPGDRVNVRRPEDNLKPEGDFTTPDKQQWRPAERPKQVKPQDNLRPEGDFERQKPDEWRPGDRAPVQKPKDNLRPEGDFERRKPDEWQPGDRAPVRRPQDNLKPEGDFTSPDKEQWRPAERPKQVKPEDNLKPEGEFDRPKHDKWRPGDRVPVHKPEDNLKPEGDFTTPKKDEWRPAERPKQKKPEDNLRPEGDFTKRKPEEWQPGDRAPVKRPEDNLKPEGDFTTPDKQQWRPAERPRQKIPEDNLRPEGDFERQKPEEWRPGDRAPVQKPKDNLRPEGDFERRKPEEWQPGDRAPVRRPQDNLKPEGDFTSPDKEKWRPAERAKQVKPEDNLRPEGDFERRKPEEWQPGDRAPVRRPQDNLKPEGDFTSPDKQQWRPAERPKQVKPEDNLKPEGEFERRKHDEWRPGDRVPVHKPEDNLKPEGDFTTPKKDEWRPAERPKQKKPEDNLRPEGDFAKRKPEEWQPGDRAPVRRPEDNLKPEGEFTTPKKDEWRPAERPTQKKPEDNLKPEGEFTSTRTNIEDYKVVIGDRAEIIRRTDNIITEGEFTDTTTSRSEYTIKPVERTTPVRRNTWTKIEGDMTTETTNQSEFIDYTDIVERTTVVTKKSDNLIQKGAIDFVTSNQTDYTEKVTTVDRPQRRRTWTKEDFEKFYSTDDLQKVTTSQDQYRTYEEVDVRQKQIIREDNLQMEGIFETHTISHDAYQPKISERPKQKKPTDNLKPEGEFEKPKYEEWQPAERVVQKKPKDNLKPEGDFEQQKPEEWRPADRQTPIKPKDNLKPEGEFEQPKHDKWQPAERVVQKKT